MFRAKVWTAACFVILLTVSDVAGWAQTIAPGDRVRVTSAAPLKIGQRLVATVPTGTEVVATRVNGAWIYVETAAGSGWVHVARVERVEEAQPDVGEAPPAPSQQGLLELLASYMRQMGYRFISLSESQEQEGLIVTGFSFEDEGFSIEVVIDPIVEKGCLLLKAPRLFHAPQTAGSESRLLELLKAIGYINYSIILGKFCYDLRDGEVSFELNLAIDDVSVSYRQFEHCLKVLLVEVREKLPRLKRVWEGEYDATIFYVPGSIMPIPPGPAGVPRSGMRVSSSHQSRRQLTI